MNNKEPRSVTLKQVLLWFTGLLMASLLVINFLLNVSSSKAYMQQQLSSHSEDAATSLGLLLSTVIDANDLVSAESLIDAMFDRGYYRHIIYYDVDGQAKVLRHSTMKIEGVPSWFVDQIDLQAPEGTAQVMSGWSQLGSVSVVSHPGFAYIKLWDSLKVELIWFTLIAAVAFLVMQFVITTILLPLTRIEKQAKAIRDRDFSFRPPLPKTRELKRVAVAMNSMSDRLGKMFGEQLSLIEHLRTESFHDPITGLGNRAEFDGRLKAELESEQSTAVGSLCLIQLSDFASYNQKNGRRSGDDLLIELANTIKASIVPIAGAFVARRSGSDFSIFLPGVIDEQADKFANDLLHKLSGLHLVKQICRNDILHIGIASTLTNLPLPVFLSEADMALRNAQAIGPNGWQRYVGDSNFSTPGESVRQANEWQKILVDTLAEKNIIFHFQPVYSGDRKTILHHQVLSRIEVNGELIEAGKFIPMAERFSMLADFDRLVVDKMVRLAESDTVTRRYCINLSVHSLTDEMFVEWFLNKMTEHPDAARWFIFEVSEYSLQLANEALEKIVTASSTLGYEISIDKFGVAAVPFAYLQHLSIHYIKVDHSFIRDIQHSRDNQFFLRTVLQIAHGQDIQVIAVGVEFEDEWDSIEPLGIDGAMGYYLCRPQAKIE
ncbi:EAL domain-containing protein [Alkalimarinus alittae]|uniref:EAL domain-containing protein n=1 Tax=Alkalimarinus alittae TaxID=2961619 RepID=A0ABY6N410_9ALTE|nr:EAL domain-containing protein [Alkalimarinus alittae]UZE96722.1 EAL domain-containing protein [Alkalimarinus alittae]